MVLFWRVLPFIKPGFALKFKTMKNCYSLKNCHSRLERESTFFIWLKPVLCGFFILLACGPAVADLTVDKSAFSCKAPERADKNKSTFCFFSLSNPDEHKLFKKKYDGQYGARTVEVKEFYHTGGENAKSSLEDQFKKMLMESECDSLIISGHHTGKFSGKRTRGQKLSLDFMEDMSCEPGCANWFSNVKSLFLAGCRTVKSDTNLDRIANKAQTDKDFSALEYKEFISPADFHQIRVAEEYQLQAVMSHINLNQEFSSTLAKKNPLSHRYLRMFPESSLYGWAESAPGKDVGSEKSLPIFIKWVTNLQEQAPTRITEISKQKTEKDPVDILNFIQFMNNPQAVCREYGTAKWTGHWISAVSGKVVSGPTACYLSDDNTAKQKFLHHHKLGCDLRNALKEKNAGKVESAVKAVLNSGQEGIRANFNRLMSLIISEKDNDQKSDWYAPVLNQLKTNLDLKNAVIGEALNPNTGFVRKGDYLYFYNEMDWRKENPTRDKTLATSFLKQLNSAFEMGKENYSTSPKEERGISRLEEAHQITILRSIGDNKLYEWLSQNQDRNLLEELKQKLRADGWPDKNINLRLGI